MKRLVVCIYPSVVDCIIPDNASEVEIENRAYKLFENSVNWQFKVEEEVDKEDDSCIGAIHKL